MARLFFYFFLLFSLNISASDQDITMENNLSDDIMLWADPFTLKLLKDMKNPTDYGYFANFPVERTTTFVVQFALQNAISRELPRGSEMRVVFSKLQYGELEFILFQAQRHKHMLEINSRFFVAENDVYKLPDQKMPLRDVIKETEHHTWPFNEEECNYFSCPRSEILPIYSIFGRELLGYNVGGRELYFSQIGSAWKEKLIDIAELPARQKIRVARFIEDPQTFSHVDPNLVFENTEQEYSLSGELNSLLE